MSKLSKGNVLKRKRSGKLIHPEENMFKEMTTQAH